MKVLVTGATGFVRKGRVGRLMKAVLQCVPLHLGAVRNNRRSLVAIRIDDPAAANPVCRVGDGEDFSTAESLQRMAAAMVTLAKVPQDWLTQWLTNSL